jgi:hypothetical protein
MKKKLLLLMLVMQNSVTAWCTDAYVKVTASDNSVSWVNIQVEYKMNGNEYKVLSNCINTNTAGAIDLDNVWSESGGTGKHYYITEIYHGAFSNCSKITSITCSRSGFTTIRSSAFSRCTSLVSVSIPYVQEIEGQAFWSCTALTTVNFTWLTSTNSERSNLYKIEDQAFQYCSQLESFYIPESLRILEDYVFQGCTKLSSFTVNENNNYFIAENGALMSKDKTVLYKYAPANANTSYTIPNTVSTIKNTAFENSKNLECIIIPDGIETISSSAFLGCSALSSVNIPNSVTTIDNNAFRGCRALATIYIPNGVTNIGDNAFYLCGFTSIVLPSSVTSIGSQAFYACDALTSVTIYAPSLTNYGSNAFTSNSSSRKIYVLADKVATYQAGWSGYSSYIKAISLTANDAGTSGHWCTYYNEGSDITVADGTAIYKATLNGAKTQVTLTRLDGNIIKAGEAVVLNTTSDNIELSSAASSGSGDYADNDLKGGNMIADGTLAYTLGLVGGQLGFYKYSGTAPLDPYKAHLEIPTSSASPAPFIGFSGTTSISNLDNDNINKVDAWFDLSGRKLAEKPLKKGIYMRQGKKYIVK